MKKVVLVTGGFDPIHSGHIAFFKAAKKLGDQLVVGVNSDAWLSSKKGKAFMSFDERCAVIGEMRCVDKVIGFDDNDGTAQLAIEQILQTKNPNWKVVFANGGDRNNATTPEYIKYKAHREVEFCFGVGGEDKKNSSSWLLKKWSEPIIDRIWGSYRILDRGEGWQVKQLSFDVNSSLSNQRHFKRSEHWLVVEGSIKIKLKRPNGEGLIWVGNAGESLDIPRLTWHKAINTGSKKAIIIEVWLGEELIEDDIERSD
jgi:cytidyltransferase-like protein